MPPARHDLRRADQGDDAAHDLRHGRHRPAHRPEHRRARGLLRRDPADDRHRHVHHQRHRARRRQPAAPQPGRLLRPRQGQDPLVGQAPLQRARDSVPWLVARLRVRPEGHHLRPHRPPPEDARDRAPPRARLLDAGPAQLFLQHRDRLRRKGREVREERRIRPPRGPALDARHQGGQRNRRQEEHQVHQGGHQEAQGGEDRSPPGRPRGAPGQGRGARRRRRRDRRGPARVQRGAHPGQARQAPRRGHRRVQDPLHRRPQRRQLPPRHPARGEGEDERRRHHGDLPPSPPGRPAHARDREAALQQSILQPRAIRPLEGRPVEAQLQVLPRRPRRAASAARHDGAHRAGHPRDGSPPHRAEERPRLGRRHRPPRQPPRSRGRRAHGEPIPHRFGSYGARDQRAHVDVARDRHAHAARPHQREARQRRRQRVLWLLAALAVHGPDQPALRSHAQASSLGARAGRSHARARGLRGARRAPDALRPHLPHRDA